jgi:HEAT repeat protein
MTIDEGVIAKSAIYASRKTLNFLANIAFRDAFTEELIKDIDFESIIEEKCKIKWPDMPHEVVEYHGKLLKEDGFISITKDLIEQLYTYNQKNKTIENVRQDFITSFVECTGFNDLKAHKFAEMLFDVVDVGFTRAMQKKPSNEYLMITRQIKEIPDLIENQLQQNSIKTHDLVSLPNEFEIEIYLQKILNHSIFDVTDIYTEISILRKTENDKFGNLTVDGKKVQVSKLVKKENTIIIYGPSGSGKTTTLRWLAFEYAKKRLNNKEGFLPIYVDLNTCSDYKKGNFEDYIRSKFTYYFPDLNSSLIDQIIKYEKPLFLIDGLDLLMIHDNYNPYIKISDFVLSNKECKFVISSRPGFYDKLEINKKLAEIRPLEYYKIKYLIRKLLNNQNLIPKVEDMVFSYLKRGTNLQNPMLLKIFVGVVASRHAAKKKIPTTKAEIYESFIMDIYRHNKNEKERQVRVKAEKKQLENVLSELFFYLQTENRVSANRDNIVDLVYNSGKIEGYKHFSGPEILDDIYKLGLLREEKNNVTYGIHQSFQEYYAAKKLKSLFEHGKDVKPAFHHSKWEEVIILASEMFESSQEADKFVSKIVSSEEISLAARCTSMTSEKLQKYVFEILDQQSTSCFDFDRRKSIEDMTNLAIVGKKYSEKITLHLANILTLDTNPYVIQKAAACLGKIKSDLALQKLIDVMKHENPHVRKEAALTLGRIKSELAVQKLIEASDENPQVKQAVATALGTKKSENKIQKLVEALENDDSQVRQKAATALGKIKAKEATEELVSALSDKDRKVRRKAVSALGEIKAQNTEKQLIEALDDESKQVRRKAAASLGKMRAKNAVKKLIESLDDEDSKVRRKVAFALGEIKSREAVTKLIEVLDDDNPQVRRVATTAIGKIRAKEAGEKLIEMLDDKDSHVRREAAIALGKIEAENAVMKLIRALGDEDQEVKRVAAASLGRIKSDDTMQKLIEALDDKNPQVRRGAAAGLGEIKAEKSIKKLIEILDDSDSQVKAIAAASLGEIKAKEAVTKLMGVLDDDNPQVRRKAAASLGEIKSEEAVEKLMEALDDDNPQVRRVVASALGRIKSEKSLQKLIDSLKDEDPEVRWIIAWALGEIKSEEAVEKLVEALDDENRRVRREVVSTFGKIRSEKAVKKLLEALQDEDSQVRMKAGRSLMYCISEETIIILEDFISSNKEEEAANTAYTLLVKFKKGKAEKEKILTEYVLGK